MADEVYQTTASFPKKKRTLKNRLSGMCKSIRKGATNAACQIGISHTPYASKAKEPSNDNFYTNEGIQVQEATPVDEEEHARQIAALQEIEANQRRLREEAEAIQRTLMREAREREERRERETRNNEVDAMLYEINQRRERDNPSGYVSAFSDPFGVGKLKRKSRRRGKRGRKTTRHRKR